MKTTITLVHTNDLHSHFDQWPYTAAVVKRELARAAAAGHPAIYMDAGDHVDMSERTSYGTRARVNLRLLSDLGCCAYTLGNNETMRLKFSELSYLAKASPFPWLGANMRLPSGDPVPNITDWTMVEAGPVKVGVFGMTALPGGLADALGLKRLNEGEAIRRITAEMRAAGAHVVIFLSHFGIKWDLDYVEHGIDITVGGHTHTALAEPQWLGQTAITQAGDFGRYVGVLEIDVDLEAGKFLTCRGRLVPVNRDEVTPDEGALAILREESAAADKALGEVLTVLPADLPHDPVGESQLAPLVAEVLRQHAGAEVGLCPGGQALEGLRAGPLTREQLATVMSPMFVPALLEFKGSQLLALLEQSEDPACHGFLLWDKGMRPRGKPIGRIFTAGLDPASIDPDRVYTVGAPYLLGFPDVGYPALAGVKTVRRFMPTFVREVFEEALRQGQVELSR